MSEIVMVGAQGVLLDQGQQAVRVGTSDISLITAGSERLRVNSSGNVGIGTGNPSDKLSIEDPGEFTVISLGKKITQNNVYKASKIYRPTSVIPDFGQKTGTANFGGDMYLEVAGLQHHSYGASSYGGAIIIRAGSVSSFYDNGTGQSVDYGGSIYLDTGCVIRRIDGTDGVTIVSEAIPGDIHLRTGKKFNLSSSAAVGSQVVDHDTRMFISGRTGNVGIGTGNPLSTLHVHGDLMCSPSAVAPVSFLRTCPLSHGSYWNYYGVSIGTMWWDGSKWNIPTDGLNRGGANIMFSYAGEMFFTTGFFNGASGTLTDEQMYNQTRMKIAQNGNVGIGTVSNGGQARLDVRSAGDGSSTVNWITALFGASNSAMDADRVVMGSYQGRAIIGAHNGAVTAWRGLTIRGSNQGITTQAAPIILGNPFSNTPTAEWEVGPNSNSDFVIYLNNTGAWLARSNPAGGWNWNSDIRLKEQIEPLPNTLQTILSLNPVRYHWKSNLDAPYKTMGLIAQEVQQVLPSIVNSIPDDKLGEVLGIQYENIIPVLIGAVKEQQSTISSLSDRLARLETLLSR